MPRPRPVKVEVLPTLDQNFVLRIEEGTLYLTIKLRRDETRELWDRLNHLFLGSS